MNYELLRYLIAIQHHIHLVYYTKSLQKVKRHLRTIPLCHSISALNYLYSSSRFGKDVKLVTSFLKQHVFLFPYAKMRKNLIQNVVGNYLPCNLS